MKRAQHYRADIDGLRAVAVLAVVAFHIGALGVPSLTGGFIGVDVFFVISGYLITGLILTERAAGRFSITTFFARRIRRLLPAMLVVLIATLAVGVVLLLPSDLERLSKAAITVLFLGSNIWFWRQSGYFDPSAEFNPLLHTWSLAVEEQFYLVFPFLILLVITRWPRRLSAILAILLALSLAACVVGQSYYPSGMFFLSPFRAWEFLAGALLASAPLPRLSRVQTDLTGALGFIILAAAMLFMDGDGFPGAKAIVPVVGTVLIISAGMVGDRPSAVSRMLALTPLVNVGLLSYALYLWHWPVIVYLNYAFRLEPPIYSVPLALVLTAALAGASYHLIERPLRFRFVLPPKKTIRTGLAASAVTIGLALAAGGATDGWPQRVSPQVAALDRERSPPIPYVACEQETRTTGIGTGAGCRIGARTKAPTVLLWGDSHAIAMAPAFDDAFAGLGVGAALAVQSACPPIADVGSSHNPACRQANANTMASLAARPELRTVVLVASWWEYSDDSGQVSLTSDKGRSGYQLFPEALTRTVAWLLASGRQVILITTVPGAPDEAVLRLALATRTGAPPPAGLSPALDAERHARFEIALARLPPEVVVVRPKAWFCDVRLCQYTGPAGPLFRDHSHINERGASIIAPMLAAELRTAGLGVASTQPTSTSVVR